MRQKAKHLLALVAGLYVLLSLVTGPAYTANAELAQTKHIGTITTSAASTDNVTELAPRRCKPIIVVDKRTGERLDIDVPSAILAPEQEAHIQRMIEKKRKLVDESLIRFRSGYSLHTSPGTLNLGADGSPKPVGDNYYVIQFYSDLARVDGETRHTLERLGCILFSYIPNHAFYVKIPPEAFDTLGSMVKAGKIRYIGHIPADFRTGNELLTKAITKPDDSLPLVVHLFEDPDEAQLKTLEAVVEVSHYAKVPHFVYCTAPASSIKDIIDLSFVEWVEEIQPVVLCNNDGTIAVADDVVQYLGLDGTGVRVAVADTGIAQQGSTYHPDLPSNRVVDQYEFRTTVPGDDIAEDDTGHGTHVAGITGGSGSVDPRYRGMAPGTSLLIYKIFWHSYFQHDQFDECTERAAEHDALVFNNSWGLLNGVYDDGVYHYAEIVDSAVRGEYPGSSGAPQYMNVIVSAGNDDDLVAAPGTAKNVITVGAVKDGNWDPGWEDEKPGVCSFNDWFQGEPVCFSNHGPLDIDEDGFTRVKPDVVAPGVRITSTLPWYDLGTFEAEFDRVNGTDYYGTVDGTSMATPYVSGAVALLLQDHPELDSWPEMIKAKTVNTAIDLGYDQSKQGHGMIDAFHLIYDDATFEEALWEGDCLTTAVHQVNKYFNVPHGFKEVRVTLTWSDPAGPAELTNDLDFSVWDANDAFVAGSYSLDDNVESSRFSSGAAGDGWKVTVNTYGLNQSPQFFGLHVAVVNTDPSLFLTASCDKQTVQPGDDVKFSAEVGNWGYTAAGSFTSIDIPDDFSLQSVDMYRADGTKFRYDSDQTTPEPDIYYDGNTYSIAVGEIIHNYPRKVEWNLKAGQVLNQENYTFLLTAEARNAGQRSQYIAIQRDELFDDEVGFCDLTGDTLWNKFWLRQDGATSTWIKYKKASDLVPITGDWDGDGADGVGFCDLTGDTLKNKFYLRADDGTTTLIKYKKDSDLKPITGDWDGDGADGVGFCDLTGDTLKNKFYLRNADGTTTVIRYKKLSTYTPITGDWDGDGDDEVGFCDLTGDTLWNKFYLRNADGTTTVIRYKKLSTYTPITGDWDGDGDDEVGFCDRTSDTLKNKFYLRADDGTTTLIKYKKDSGLVPVTGNWDGL